MNNNFVSKIYQHPKISTILYLQLASKPD